MTESKTSARRLSASQRAEKAVRLRMARVSYAAIAKECGFSDESGARKAVERALAKTRKLTAESAEEMRQLDLAKLDAAEATLTGVMATGKPAEKIAASAAMVRVLKRRAELMGLDEAVKIDVRVEDPRERLARILGAVATAGPAPAVDPVPQP